MSFRLDAPVNQYPAHASRLLDPLLPKRRLANPRLAGNNQRRCSAIQPVEELPNLTDLALSSDQPHCTHALCDCHA